MKLHCKGIKLKLKHTSRGSKLINLYVAFECAFHIFACMAQVQNFNIHACVVMLVIGLNDEMKN